MNSLVQTFMDFLFPVAEPIKNKEKKITCIHCKNSFSAKEMDRFHDPTWQGCFNYCPRCGHQIGFKPRKSGSIRSYQSGTLGYVTNKSKIKEEMTLKKSDII